MKPLNVKVVLIIGVVGVALAAASRAIPAPWDALAAIIGFTAATLAGLSAAPPSITEGKPLLQGGALSAASVAFGAVVNFYPMVPAGWPQSLTFAAVALLAWLTGKALPHLGAPTAEPETLKKAAVVAALERGPQP